MAISSHASRGLILFSSIISTYHIAMAEDRASALVKEVAIIGAGCGGGVAGGAMAGLVCEPAAPACVTIGAFVGGALAAFSLDYFWSQLCKLSMN